MLLSVLESAGRFSMTLDSENVAPARPSRDEFEAAIAAVSIHYVAGCTPEVASEVPELRSRRAECRLEPRSPATKRLGETATPTASTRDAASPR